MAPRHGIYQPNLLDSEYNVTVAPLEAEDHGKMAGSGQRWGRLE
jgi:hypothetical protein